MTCIKVMGARAAFVTAVVQLLLVVSLSAVGAPSRDTCQANVITKGSWTSIRLPSFGDDRPQQLTAYVVHPLDPKRMFVTNGTTIMRSDDGGCTWANVFHLADSGIPADAEVRSLLEPRITELHIPESSAARDKILALVAPDPETLPAHIELDYTTLEGVLPKHGVLISKNGGGNWELMSRGFPAILDRAVEPPVLTSLFGLRVAPSDPYRVYLSVNTIPIGPRELPVELGDIGRETGAGLYWSRDGGSTWGRKSDFVAVTSIDVNPARPDRLWATGPFTIEGSQAPDLQRSEDGGATWDPQWINASAVVASRSPDSPLSAYAATSDVGGPQGVHVIDGASGDSEWQTGSPDAQSLAVAANDLFIAAASKTQQAHVFDADSGRWSNISRRERSYEDVTVDRTPDPAAYFYSADSNTIEKYTGGIGASSPELMPQPPPNVANAPVDCLVPSDPREGPGLVPPLPDTDTPVPSGVGPVFVSNFSNGCITVFDRWGNATILGQAPRNTEGIAFDPDGGLIVTTRYSDLLTRMDATGAVTELAPVDDVEGASFDKDGNLFVVSNGWLGNVYEFPAPQVPGQKPELVWHFAGKYDCFRCVSFLEDTRVAPDSSPFAGDLFVQYSHPDREYTGRTDAIARLRRTDKGWKRMRDFAVLPKDFYSIGMAFAPDGDVLVPENCYRGCGDAPARILRYSADGRSHSLFASLPNTELVKLDVTPDGFVYVTGTFWGQELSPDSGNDAARHAVFRFDNDGNRLSPDFTQYLDMPTGIAVPNVITGVVHPPPSVLGGSTPSTFTTGAAPPPFHTPPHTPAQAPNPAPLPIQAPNPAPHPHPQPQPNPNPQANSQANPLPVSVTQRQEQAQMAFVHASQQLKEQLGGQQAMVRSLQQRNDPLAAAKFGLTIGALSMMIMYGLASATVKRAFIRDDPRS